MKTFTAVFLLYLAVQDCSAAAVDPGTCRGLYVEDIGVKGFCVILPSENKCILPFSANITVGPPTCTCECDLILNEKPVEICCDTKTVGDYSYTKVSVGEVPTSCLNNCIYTRDDKPGSKYCFARGEQEVHCLDSPGAANGTAVLTEATETELPNVSNLCPDSSRIIAVGPFGSHSTGFPFDDTTVAKNGNITQIKFRTGSVMDQIQATYGNVPSPVHGGAGGEVRGPYNLPEGSFVVKVAGLVNPNTFVQSLTFTNQNGQTQTFGNTGNGGERFESAQPDCFLRYFSGSTTGQGTKNNFLNQIVFNWCCPAV